MFNKTASATDEPIDRSAEPLFRTRPDIHTPGRRRSYAEAPASDPTKEAAAQASNLGDALQFEGAVSGDGDLLLDGRFKGDIRVARLVISATALVEGAIVAQQVEVRGRVVGSIEAQVVRLHATAHVEGDIRHGRLSMEESAHFEGRSQPLRKAEAPAPQPALQPAPRPTAVMPFPAPAEPREEGARAPAATAG